MNWHTVGLLAAGGAGTLVALFGVALYGAWVIANEEAEMSRDDWEHVR